MEDLSLHILDIIQNSISAKAKNIEIELIDSRLDGFITLRIVDDGEGMDQEILKRAEDPFYTTKGKKTGLGIPLLKQSCLECEGDFRIESSPGRGCSITAKFRRDHIDRKPIGDIGSTIVSAIVTCPECRFRFIAKKVSEKGEEEVFIFDTDDIKKELEDIPINSPPVLKFIKGLFEVLKFEH
jgi:anti-sigma regulatory factor (Ser/Thr protein kinase)